MALEYAASLTTLLFVRASAMNCALARALINQEYAHPDRDHRSDALLFHLASCTRCRAYRAALNPAHRDDTTLLHGLLNETFAVPAVGHTVLDPDFDLPPTTTASVVTPRKRRRSLVATTMRWAAIAI